MTRKPRDLYALVSAFQGLLERHSRLLLSLAAILFVCGVIVSAIRFDLSPDDLQPAYFIALLVLLFPLVLAYGTASLMLMARGAGKRIPLSKAWRIASVAQLAERPVPLLLAVEPENNATLLAVMEGGENSRLFQADDIAALRENYRPAWGPIHVAGTQIKAGEQRKWDLRVPSSYKVQGSLLINGQPFSDGEKITLSRQTVSLQADEAAGLIWAEIAELPTAPPPERPYRRGF